MLKVARRSARPAGCLARMRGGITATRFTVTRVVRGSSLADCKTSHLFHAVFMYCFVCLEADTSYAHYMSTGCPLFCTDDCDCVPCSECVRRRGCSQCDNSGTGCPTCAAETPEAAAARLMRSKASQLLKRAQGWCGPRTHNPTAQGRARTAFVADTRNRRQPPAAELIEGSVIAHMLQRLRHPLVHHCEASAIMRQLSTWLNAFWAHSSDPAGEKHHHRAGFSILLLPVTCRSCQLSRHRPRSTGAHQDGQMTRIVHCFAVTRCRLGLSPTPKLSRKRRCLSQGASVLP